MYDRTFGGLWPNRFGRTVRSDRRTPEPQKYVNLTEKTSIWRGKSTIFSQIWKYICKINFKLKCTNIYVEVGISNWVTIRYLLYWLKCNFWDDILVNSGPEFLPNLAEVRPNGSAEPSVEMAEPFGFGRTTFFAVRSYTSNSNKGRYSHSQWLFYKFFSNFTNKLVKQSLRVTVVSLKFHFHFHFIVITIVWMVFPITAICS